MRALAVTPFSEISENVQQHLRKCRSVARARRQLASTDVVLLVNFVQAQPGLRAARESWTPLCAPRLSARGFVHAHIAFVDGAHAGTESPPPAGEEPLCVVLLSTSGAPETFQRLRGASAAIAQASARETREGLPLSGARKKLTRALSLLRPGAQALERDGLRAACLAAAAADDASAGGGGGERDSTALAAQAQATHFAFRYGGYGASVAGGAACGGRGLVAQYVASRFFWPLGAEAARAATWAQYQALALRLRAGSARATHVHAAGAQHASADGAPAAGAGAADDENDDEAADVALGAHALFESSPEYPLAYHQAGAWTHVALSGDGCAKPRRARRARRARARVANNTKLRPDAAPLSQGTSCTRRSRRPPTRPSSSRAARRSRARSRPTRRACSRSRCCTESSSSSTAALGRGVRRSRWVTKIR